MAYKRLSLALWYLDDKEEAVEAIKKSIALKPDFASAHYNLACFYAKMEQKEDMLTSLQQAIELDEYSNYREMASNDDDFEAYDIDDDFLAIVESENTHQNKQEELMASEDGEAISAWILLLEKEIPAEAVEWDSYDNGVSELIEEKIDIISTEALVYLFQLVMVNVDIEDFNELYKLVSTLEQRGVELEDLLIENWQARYENTDPGHLGGIDYQILELLKKVPVDKLVKLVLWGLKSHGPDALRDYEGVCAPLLQQLPARHELYAELVEVLDTYLHQETYKDEPIESRKKRISIALAPPPVEVPKDDTSRWATEKAGINHFHPQNVITAACHLAIQSDPEAIALVKKELPKICDFVINPNLPIDLRVDAVKSIIKEIGTEEQLQSISPALKDKSYALIEAIGEVMAPLNMIPAEAKEAVTFLIQESQKEGLDDYDLHDIVKALSWLQDERVVDALIECLSNGKEAVRRESLYALGIQKASKAIPQIVHQLKEGSGQCVTAAAKALDQIGGEAHKALEDKETYEIVVERAKKSPRWATKALNYIRVPQVVEDQLELLGATHENESYMPLSEGIAKWAIQESLPKLLFYGFDEYINRNISGRNFFMMFNAIARKHGDLPNEEIIDEVVKIIKNSAEEDVIELTEMIESDKKYADKTYPTKEDLLREVKFTQSYQEAVQKISPAAEKLVKVMFTSI